MKNGIISCSIWIAFYIIGAFATTDILRLLKGNETAVWARDCYCPDCRQKIFLRDQVPVISYFINHKKCRYCGKRIPFSDIFLELFLFLSLSAIAVLTDYSWKGFLLCLGLYETVKIVYLLKTGRREEQFLKNLLYSIFSNAVIFTLLAVLFLLRQF